MAATEYLYIVRYRREGAHSKTRTFLSRDALRKFVNERLLGDDEDSEWEHLAPLEFLDVVKHELGPAKPLRVRGWYRDFEIS